MTDARQDNGRESEDAAGMVGPDAGERSPRGDRSVRSRAEDTLGRVPFADALARQIAEAAPEEEVVFGLVGPYGAGKTSLLNMLAEALEDDHEGVVVLRFTPWIFTGTEHLVGVLFEELGAQLLEQPSEQLKKVGEALEAYGGVLGVLRVVPGVGYWAGLAEKGAGLLGRFLSLRGPERPPSLLGQRRELEEALSELDEKVIVLLDEVDRLRRQEIRDVVGLVRLNADLPNVVFVLAYERWRVEEALEEVEGDGRAYLEKIVQVVQDIPKAQDVDLSKELLDAINGATGGAPETGPFDEHRFWNLFHAVIRPLVGSVRDVRRYANALPVTLDVLGDEVALEDVLALEAIRVLLPEAFAALVASVGALTTPHDQLGVIHHSSDPRTDAERTKVEAFVRSGGDKESVTKEARDRLFPASLWTENNHHGSEWLKDWSKGRLVAHARVLAFYLEKRLPEGVLPAREVQNLFEALGDRERFEGMLSSMDSATLEHALKRLEDYEDDYPPGSVRVAVEVLSNQLPRLREGSEGFGDFGARTTLRRVVLRLLRKVDDQEALGRILREVRPGLETLSAQLMLAELAGRQSNGASMISDEEIAHQRESLLTDMEHRPPEQLAQERDLVRLLLRARETDADRGRVLLTRLAERDEVFLSVLRGLYRETHTATVGDVIPRAEYELGWDTLVSLFGDDVVERRVVELFREMEFDTSGHGLDDKTQGALRLARRYVDGYRPDW